MHECYFKYYSLDGADFLNTWFAGLERHFILCCCLLFFIIIIIILLFCLTFFFSSVCFRIKRRTDNRTSAMQLVLLNQFRNEYEIDLVVKMNRGLPRAHTSNTQFNRWYLICSKSVSHETDFLLICLHIFH